jgi:hypothetical protein
MIERATGGPAFPTDTERQVGPSTFHFEGMTLRDYLAAHCPITWTEAQKYNEDGDEEMKFFVEMRSEYADKMIAERAK